MFFNLWTDGARKNDTGQGGWGAVASFEEKKVWVMGGYRKVATNNQMETVAVYGGFHRLGYAMQPSRLRVNLFTDSRYVILGLERLVSGGTLSSNKAEWEQLAEILDQVDLTVTKVKGHGNNTHNVLADLVAKFCATLQLDYNRMFSTVDVAIDYFRKYAYNEYRGR